MKSHQPSGNVALARPATIVVVAAVLPARGWVCATVVLVIAVAVFSTLRLATEGRPALLAVLALEPTDALLRALSLLLSLVLYNYYCKAIYCIIMIIIIIT